MAVRVPARRCVRAARLGAAVALAVCGSLAAASGQRDMATQLAERLSTYLDDLEPKLSMLVAEERFEQTITSVSESGTTQAPRRRVLVSDLGFVRLPESQAWLGHRRVHSVNGRSVRSAGPSLAEALVRSGADDYQQARALLLAGARHNLGEPRTTNLPTLPLELLHQRHRWRYDIRLEAYERVEGRRTARVLLEERSTPSLVRRGDGGDLMARTVGWIEPETGGL